MRQASLSRLQDMAARDPDSPRVTYYLGLRLQQAGQTAAAAAALEHAASLSDSEDIYLTWAGAVPVSQAAQILMSFLTRHPNSAAAHLALARLFRQQNDLSSCYEQASFAVLKGEHNLQAWQLYGDSALETGHSQEAADAYRHAAALDPKTAGNYIGLGAALIQLNRRAEGIASYHQAADLAAQDGAAWVALGGAFLQSAESAADLETARKYLNTGMRLRPDLETAYLELGECSLKQKRWKEALIELERAQKFQPDEPEVAFALAQVYRGLGDAKHTAEALGRHQDLEKYRGERAGMLLREGVNDDAQTHLDLARLAVSHKAFKAAIAEYQTALARSPYDPAIMRELSAVQHRAGEK